jgi:hypothetical protein
MIGPQPVLTAGIGEEGNITTLTRLLSLQIPNPGVPEGIEPQAEPETYLALIS